MNFGIVNRLFVEAAVQRCIHNWDKRGGSVCPVECVDAWEVRAYGRDTARRQECLQTHSAAVYGTVDFVA